MNFVACSNSIASKRWCHMHKSTAACSMVAYRKYSVQLQVEKCEQQGAELMNAVACANSIASMSCCHMHKSTAACCNTVAHRK